MDTGAVIDRVRVPIDPAESAGTLLARLADLGAPVLVESLRALVSGTRVPEPQPDAGVTLAPKISPEDVAIDFAAPVRGVVDLIRSADPAPGAHTRFRDRRLKILQATPVEGEPAPEAAGTVVAVPRPGVVVACGDGLVRLDVVQPEGKPRMDGAAFVNGYHPEVGERLGGDAPVASPGDSRA